MHRLVPLGELAQAVMEPHQYGNDHNDLQIDSLRNIMLRIREEGKK